LTKAFVAVGSNIEDPKSQVLQALDELDRIASCRVVARSSLYRTAPVGHADQPDFINAVAQIETGLAARALLEALLELEGHHGRRRSFPNAPRTLDLDLLVYGNAMVHEEGLTLPHPRMHERAFVLAPLAEIAGNEEVPGRGRVADLLERIGRVGVERLDGA
jgi:2-amino-4-hydroxy-6-hydroxymethyldihydropteridine diphosphokinase